MHNNQHRQSPKHHTFIFILLGAVIIFLIYKINNLEDFVSSLKQTNDLAVESITTNQQQASVLISNKFDQISGTIDTLKKLSTTDSELLKKYSRVYFLNENYIPLSLTTIDPTYVHYPTKQIQILSDVYPHLKKLIDENRAVQETLTINSGYRSFESQVNLKSKYSVVYGKGTTNEFVAEQGYSEHQLGTAVDFGITSTTTKFENSLEYIWLSKNAYKYGFILSYPANNPYYTFEPWHWRFVGITLATKLHENNQNFYSLDQKEIDTYLATIFD